MTKVAPSILAADFARMGEAVEHIGQWGADLVHFDVMDGRFVPNLTFGPEMCRALRGVTKLPLDVHLMVEEPARYVEPFHEAGADYITFHVEAERHIHRTLTRIRELGMRAGVVLNPATPLCAAEEALPYCDLVLFMSVNPGFGGQAFIPETVEKIRALKKLLKKRGLHADIEVDGGINAETGRLCAEAGATILVAGSSVFRAPEPAEMVRKLQAL